MSINWRFGDGRSEMEQDYDADMQFYNDYEKPAKEKRETDDKVYEYCKEIRANNYENCPPGISRQTIDDRIVDHEKERSEEQGSWCSIL